MAIDHVDALQPVVGQGQIPDPAREPHLTPLGKVLWIDSIDGDAAGLGDVQMDLAAAVGMVSGCAERPSEGGYRRVERDAVHAYAMAPRRQAGE